MNFRFAIYNLRAELGLSKVDFAKKLDVSDTLVSRWESGNSHPNYQNMCKLEFLQNSISSGCNHDLDVVFDHNALREARVCKKITQKDLAEKVNSYRVYISELETGKRVPNDELVEKLGTVLGMQKSKFFKFRSEINEYQPLKSLFNSERFNELLQENNITLKDCARALGVSSTAVYAWQHHKFEPKFDRIEQIANFFNVRVDTLLLMEDQNAVTSVLGKIDNATLCENFIKIKNPDKLIKDEELIESYGVISEYEFIKFLRKLGYKVNIEYQSGNRFVKITRLNDEFSLNLCLPMNKFKKICEITQVDIKNVVLQNLVNSLT